MGNLYIGQGNIARKVKNVYVGVGGVARKVQKIYVGDINGKARQVYNAYTPKSYNRVVFDGGTYIGNCEIPVGAHYYTQVPTSDVNEALDNGYTKLRVHYEFKGGNYSTGYGTHIGTEGEILAYAATKSPYADSYHNNWHRYAYTGEREYTSENVLIGSFDGDLLLERNTYCQFGVKNNLSNERFYMWASYGGAYPIMRFTAQFVQ